MLGTAAIWQTNLILYDFAIARAIPLSFDLHVRLYNVVVILTEYKIKICDKVSEHWESKTNYS